MHSGLLSLRDQLEVFLHSFESPFKSHDMVFARTSLSFVLYAVVFGAASLSAAVFIAPMMFLSFFFSGMVIIFSSLSYTTFKMASSNYNHTVLFLNRLIRGLADNIPPSVGIVETVDIEENKKRVRQLFHSGFKEVNEKKKQSSNVLLQAWNLLFFWFPKKKSAVTPDTAAPALDPDAPVVTTTAFNQDPESIGPDAPVIYDEEMEVFPWVEEDPPAIKEIPLGDPVEQLNGEGVALTVDTDGNDETKL